jgi:hypothetical protein
MPRKRRRWMLWLVPVVVVAAIVAGVLLSTQGGSGAPSAATAANVKACQDYRAQGAAARKVTDPGLSDIRKWTGWVAADAAEAAQGGQLKSDLNAWVTATDTSLNPAAAHSRILRDCAAIGVTAG